MNSSPGTIGSSRPRTPSIRHAMIATQAMSFVVTLSKAGDSDDMARLRQLGNAAIAANLVPTGSDRLFSGLRRRAVRIAAPAWRGRPTLRELRYYYGAQEAGVADEGRTTWSPAWLLAEIVQPGFPGDRRCR